MDARRWFEEGQVQMRAGHPREGVEAFTHAIEGGYEEKLSRLSRGVGYLQMKDFEDAYEEFTAVLRKDAQNARAYFYRGVTEMRQEHYARAIRDFDRVVEIDPGHGEALLARGVAEAHVGRADEAARDLKQAVMVAEVEAHRFADQYLGGWRTHMDGVLRVLSRHPGCALSEEETEEIRERLTH